MDDGHDAHESKRRCIEETLYRDQTVTQQKFQQYLDESGKANAVQAEAAVMTARATDTSMRIQHLESLASNVNLPNHVKETALQ
jgi:hypothetical protein